MSNTRSTLCCLLASLCILFLYGMTASVAAADNDSDGIEDSVDNCVDQYNPQQADADGDGFGDYCDNCPATYNPSQLAGDCDVDVSVSEVWSRTFSGYGTGCTTGEVVDALVPTWDGGAALLSHYDSIGDFVLVLDSLGDSTSAFAVSLEAQDMVVDLRGGFVLAGSSSQSPGSAGVARLLDGGAPDWSTTLVEDSTGSAAALALTSQDRTVVCGSAGTSAMVALVDSTGGVVWTRLIDSAGASLSASAVCVLPDQSMVVGGSIASERTWFARLGPNGSLLWMYSFAYDGVTLGDVAYDPLQQRIVAAGTVLRGWMQYPFYFTYLISLSPEGDSLQAVCHARGCCPRSRAMHCMDDGNSIVFGAEGEYTFASDQLLAVLPGGDVGGRTQQAGGHPTHGDAMDATPLNRDASVIVAGYHGTWYDPPPVEGGLYVAKLQFDDYTPQVCGDCDIDGVGPDIADLIYLVTYMFQNGPALPLPHLADVNGDLVGPDIADLVYLVTYMFQDGPAPICRR